jgi:HEAT repeat protein
MSAISKSKIPGVKDLLLSIAREDKSFDARLAAMRSLERFEGEDVDKLFLDLARADNTKEVRRLAIAELSQREAKGTLELFIEILTKDDSTGMQVIAADALAALGDRAALEPLETAMSKTKDAELLVAAALAMEKLGSRKVIPALASIMKKAEETNLRIAATRALSQMNSQEAMPDLIEAMTSDSSSSVKEYAAQALAKVGGAAVIPLLPELIKHVEYPWELMRNTMSYEHAWALRNDRVRIKTWSTAVKKLGLLGEPEKTPELEKKIKAAIAGLDSERWRDRRKAEDSLRAMGLAAKEALQEAAKSGSLTVQYSAKQLLGELNVWQSARKFVETNALQDNLVFLILLLSEKDENLVKAAEKKLKEKSKKDFKTQREWLRWYTQEYSK